MTRTLSDPHEPSARAFEAFLDGPQTSQPWHAVFWAREMANAGREKLAAGRLLPAVRLFGVSLVRGAELRSWSGALTRGLGDWLRGADGALERSQDRACRPDDLHRMFRFWGLRCLIEASHLRTRWNCEMKVLGVGLSKTGTKSLHRALQLLGMKSLHHDTSRLNDILDGSSTKPDFRRYDDVDAVLDLPSVLFYRELLVAYPEAKAILTIRDVETWWGSALTHFRDLSPLPPTIDGRAPLNALSFRAAVRNLAYGSSMPKEYLYKKHYLEHNARVRTEIPAERLLVLDIVAGDGWQTLCPFLGVAAPGVPFPHEN